MDRGRPPVTVSAPGSGGLPPDVLEGATPRSRRRLPTAALSLALVAVVVLGVAAVRDQESRVAPRPTTPPTTPPTAPSTAPSIALPTAPPKLTATSGITATASLAGATTDQPSVQRLALTVDLPAFDGRSDSGGRLLGDEVLLRGVSVRGFTVEEPDVVRALDRLVSRTCRRPGG